MSLEKSKRLTVIALIVQLQEATKKRVTQAESAASARTSWHLREELLGEKFTAEDKKYAEKINRQYTESLAVLKEREDDHWKALEDFLGLKDK